MRLSLILCYPLSGLALLGPMFCTLAAEQAPAPPQTRPIPPPSPQPLIQANRPARIAFLIGEDEYETATTLPRFVREELAGLDFDCTYWQVNPQDPNDFPALTNFSGIDLLVLSVRRRTPPHSQLNLVRDYLLDGRPLVALRTASHAFDATPPDPDHAAWASFDVDILGADYQGHYNNEPPGAPPTLVQINPQAARHPIVAGLPRQPFSLTSHLYKCRQPAPTVTILLLGHVQGQAQTEPVAWINTAAKRRVFYTSLGNPADFQSPPFRRLLRNAILWALGQ